MGNAILDWTRPAEGLRRNGRRLFLLVIAGLLFSASSYAQERTQAEEREQEVEATTDTTEQSEQEGFLDRVGFYANLEGGYMARFNGFSTYEPLLQTQIPVDFDNRALSVLNLNVQAGLFGVRFVDYDYQRSIPRSKFQSDALAFNEDRASGLEKYTFGIDTTPLWLLILPDDVSGLVKRVLSLRFRTVRELAQTTATVTEASLAVPDGGGITDYGNPASYTSIDEGTTYSFRTKYRFNSISLPLALFLNNTGHLNVGVARWRFARTYAASVPGLGNRQVVFDGAVNTTALTVEFYFRIPDDLVNARGKEVPEGLEGLSIDIFYGYGVRSDWDSPDADLNRVFFPNGDRKLSNTNHNYEVHLSYPLLLLEDVKNVDARLRFGLEANTFTTTFGNFKNSEETKYKHAKNKGDTFGKIDWIIRPWVRFSLGY